MTPNTLTRDILDLVWNVFPTGSLPLPRLCWPHAWICASVFLQTQFHNTSHLRCCETAVSAFCFLIFVDNFKNSTVFCCCFFFHFVHVGKIVRGENQFYYKHQIQSSVKSGHLTLIEELISALMGREIHLGCLKEMYLLRRSGCTFPLWLMRLFVFSSPLRRFIKRVEARFILINHPMVPWCHRKLVLWVLRQAWLLLDVMGTWQPMGCGI